MNKNLKKYRISLDMTSKEVAEYLNMSPSAYSALENGTTKLDMERAAKLAKLNCIALEPYLRGRVLAISSTPVVYHLAQAE